MEAARTSFDVHSGRRILIVEDHEPTLDLLQSLLRHGMRGDVRATSDPRNVVALYREFEPDLLLVDLEMPGLDGALLLRQLSARATPGEFRPIVVFSGDASPTARRNAFALGACDFIAKPILAPEITVRLEHLLRLRELTTGIEEEVQERLRELRDAELDVASRLALVAECRDYPDGAHVQRVGQLAALIARELQQPDDFVTLIRFAAPLHDLGKVAIPDTLLLKPGALTEDEQKLMRLHTSAGAQMLTGSPSPILQLAEEIALYHHENWDGSGYNAGLAGEEIPLAGRIVAVADVFDTLTHPRPYKHPWPLDEAITWMESMRGRKFDPAALDSLLGILGDTRTQIGEDAVAGAAVIILPPRAGGGGLSSSGWPWPVDGHKA